MSLLNLLLQSVKREAPRYYRSVREVERLPARQRMSVDSLPGLLAARNVPAAEREMFGLAHPLPGSPTEPVSRDELADYLQRTLSAPAGERTRRVQSGTVVRPRKIGGEPHPIYHDAAGYEDLDVILSHPSVSAEERERILNVVQARPSRVPPEQLSFPELPGGSMRGAELSNNIPPELQRFFDLLYKTFHGQRPYATRPAATLDYAPHTLSGLDDYFVSEYVLRPAVYDRLTSDFGKPSLFQDHHFTPETLYHVRGGTARVTDASSHDPVLHIAELQSDPGNVMRRFPPRLEKPYDSFLVEDPKRNEVKEWLLMSHNQPPPPPLNAMFEEFKQPEYARLRETVLLPDYESNPDYVVERMASLVLEPAAFSREMKYAREIGQPHFEEVQRQRNQLVEQLRKMDPNFERLREVYSIWIAPYRPLPYPLVGDTAEWTRHALRNQLAYALENDFAGMSTASADTVLPYVGGKPEGQIAYYDNLVPSLLERIARSYDPQARVVETLVRTPDGQPWWTERPNPPADKRRAYYLRFTPELRRAVAERGIPYFSLLPFLLGEPVDDTTVQ